MELLHCATSIQHQLYIAICYNLAQLITLLLAVCLQIVMCHEYWTVLTVQVEKSRVEYKLIMLSGK